MRIASSSSSNGITHATGPRSEEHTSELQSQSNLVCRLLLEKKKRPAAVQHPFLPSARHDGCEHHGDRDHTCCSVRSCVGHILRDPPLRARLRVRCLGGLLPL